MRPCVTIEGYTLHDVTLPLSLIGRFILPFADAGYARFRRTASRLRRSATGDHGSGSTVTVALAVIGTRSPNVPVRAEGIGAVPFSSMTASLLRREPVTESPLIVA